MLAKTGNMDLLVLALGTPPPGFQSTCSIKHAGLACRTAVVSLRHHAGLLGKWRLGLPGGGKPPAPSRALAERVATGNHRAAGAPGRPPYRKSAFGGAKSRGWRRRRSFGQVTVAVGDEISRRAQPHRRSLITGENLLRCKTVGDGVTGGAISAEDAWPILTAIGADDA